MREESIKNFYGQVIGRIRYYDNGNKELFNFAGQKLGWYTATTNTTHDFSGRVVAMGDALTMLIKDGR